MGTSANVEHGLPGERDSIIRLLNESLDTDFDKEYLKWEYEEYPGFSDEHVFHISEGDTPIAFRRLFRQEIIDSEGNTLKVFTGAESVVKPRYRGKGLFSALLGESSDFAKDHSVDINASFNRKGVVTHSMKESRGWYSRTLPVWVKVLSPGEIIPDYAEMALGNETATSLIKRTPSQFYRLLPSRLVTDAVEFASSDKGFRAFGSSGDQAPKPSDDMSVKYVGSYPASVDVSRVESLYEEVVKHHDCHFRRNRTDINHMLSHPRLANVATVTRSDDLVGFAPVAMDSIAEPTEVKVLDIAAVDEAVEARIIEAVEEIADEHNANLISAITDRNPGKHWAKVEKQVMMWEEVSEGANLHDQSLRVSHYDVV